MARFTTPTKKDDILEILVSEFERVRDDFFSATRGDIYYDDKEGAYNALRDVLVKIKIYDKEN